ncbi:recombining binding protein suppressor of hairless-like protein isoform X1 [Entelurus aequoreus]|uniref:recombining binding protein suppressor of hairless-like protein isoform X1 n=2 Tax=Entelurus aequoreus TaxID=161455 RepID=UPI002B1DC06E|nr:recombining binding protein suppressor of hairless-like protein isoform X1 [Entelurus aequoreus]XP_061906566.1 recombining binding protein suppressor of hairless-like protein isoform X1 [Entelurus aequoreus]
MQSVRTMMDELDVVEDGHRASRQQVACFQPGSTGPITHLLDGHVEWDRRAQSACPSLGASRESEQCVVILHAKVAQKSYGNEKRFFCPPPCVYISGHAWRLMQDCLTAGSGGLCGYMCVDTSAQTHGDAFKLTFDLLTDRRMFACAKSLFISDQDKRKHFRLLLQIFMASRQEVGSFHSRLIKVISKPSQKRQSMKNADLCISACSRVALFNRLRSQTVSTRYLAVEGGAFIASARQWTAFTITLVEEPRSDRGHFALSEGFVCYGSVVQLVCTESGITLPPMVIRKVNKQHAILEVDEPVSQLHKCAFEFRDKPQAYLCLSNDAIVVHQATSGVRDPNRVVLNDGACWTIIGVEVVDFTFNQEAASVQTPVSPFPVVSSLEINGGGHVAMLELVGENFGPHLKVCFGNIEAETMFKCPKSLLCVVPDISAFSVGWQRRCSMLTVPVSLLRVDGVLYRTSFTFTYTPELQAPPAALRTAGITRDRVGEAEQEEDVLLESIHQEFTRANFHLFMQT